MTQPPDIAFRYLTSKVVVAALIVVGVLAILALAISGVPEAVRLPLMVVAGALLGTSVGRLLRPRVASVAWRGDGTVDLRLNDKPTDDRREVRGELRGGRVLGPLIVLALRWPVRERAFLWLLPDNLDADTRRRLRMRLATRSPATASGNADSG